MRIRRLGAAIVTATLAYTVGSLSAQTASCAHIAELILVDNTRRPAQDVGPIEQHCAIDHAQIDSANLAIRADMTHASRNCYIVWKIKNETNGWCTTS